MDPAKAPGPRKGINAPRWRPLTRSLKGSGTVVFLSREVDDMPSTPANIAPQKDHTIYAE